MCNVCLEKSKELTAFIVIELYQFLSIYAPFNDRVFENVRKRLNLDWLSIIVASASFAALFAIIDMIDRSK